MAIFFVNLVLFVTNNVFSDSVAENGVSVSQIDPPDDEPPSLKIGSMEENENLQLKSSPSRKEDMLDDQGFLRLDPESQDAAYVSATESERVDEDYSDEKKTEIENDEVDSEEQGKSNGIEPIETSIPDGFSPVGRQSPALRGAHEILKRRRAEA